jgi:hypothetical protein
MHITHVRRVYAHRPRALDAVRDGKVKSSQDAVKKSSPEHVATSKDETSLWLQRLARLRRNPIGVLRLGRASAGCSGAFRSASAQYVFTHIAFGHFDGTRRSTLIRAMSGGFITRTS